MVCVGPETEGSQDMTDTDVNQRLVEAGSTVEMAEALRASGTVDDLLARRSTAARWCSPVRAGCCPG